MFHIPIVGVKSPRDDLAMGPTLTITLDCSDPDRLSGFWAAALGYADGGTHGGFRRLVPPGAGRPVLLLQAVTEPKAGKNRMHLDLEVDDAAAEVARLERLGASRVTPDPVEDDEHRWYVLADPEGNELCVVEARTR